MKKKSNESVRFCLPSFRCQKKLKKPNFQHPTPMVYSTNDIKFCVEPPGGMLLKNEVWDQNLRCAHF